MNEKEIKIIIKSHQDLTVIYQNIIDRYKLDENQGIEHIKDILWLTLQNLAMLKYAIYRETKEGQ